MPPLARHRQQRSACKTADGFTLVELLVVITIIAILVALLLPAVQAAREAARRTHCSNNVRQLALATLAHESALGFFPTGGWTRSWLGHPDRGFDQRQPGSWVYNILPFMERQSLHDLGISGGNMTIENANAQRIATSVSTFNCPSRRPSEMFAISTAYAITFRLTAGTVAKAARSDYAINGGDYPQWSQESQSPQTLDAGDDPAFAWNDMSLQTGISYERSRVKLTDITDGACNTFLIGEKYINRYHYTDGKDSGDKGTMYCGDDLDMLRWTGYLGTVGTSSNNNLPRQDELAIGGGTVASQRFGSAHAGSFNMSFCDGSVRALSYSIDGEIYRRLGNRRDSLLVGGY